MWETVERMVQNGDAWFVLIIIGLIIFAAKQGYMKVRTEKILIGRESSEKERLLMKKQSEYAHTECMAFEKELPRFEGYDETLGQRSFAGYEEALPGAADRILKMAEKQAEHRQYVEKKMVDTESRDSFLGIISALAIALFIIIAGTTVIVAVPGIHATVAGLIIDLTGIATVIGTFLKGTGNS